MTRTYAWAPQRSHRSVAFSSHARGSTPISLSVSSSLGGRFLPQNLPALMTITFLAPRELLVLIPVHSSAARTGRRWHLSWHCAGLYPPTHDGPRSSDRPLFSYFPNERVLRRFSQLTATVARRRAGPTPGTSRIGGLRRPPRSGRCRRRG